MEMTDFKRRCFAEINRRQLTSCMNKTKWRALAQVMSEEMPFRPAFQEKWLTEEEPYGILDPAPWYFGNWHEFSLRNESGYSLDLEWVKIATRRVYSPGRLVTPTITDVAPEMNRALEDRHIPFDRDGPFVMIYGHR